MNFMQRKILTVVLAMLFIASTANALTWDGELDASAILQWKNGTSQMEDYVTLKGNKIRVEVQKKINPDPNSPFKNVSLVIGQCGQCGKFHKAIGFRYTKNGIEYRFKCCEGKHIVQTMPPK